MTMTYCTRYTVELQCHPTSRAQSARGIQAQVGWGQGGALALTFSLTGDVVRFRIPTPQPSRRADEQLELDALIRLECLPLAPLCARLQLALSAVIEDKQGVLSYWALTHPPGKPDFHHPDAFVLELERPEATRVSDPAEGGKR